MVVSGCVVYTDVRLFFFLAIFGPMVRFHFFLLFSRVLMKWFLLMIK